MVTKAAARTRRSPVSPARRVLVIDVGGSHVKFFVEGGDEPRKFDSGDRLGPQQMIDGVLAASDDWSFDVATVGYPGPVADGRPAKEPANLGRGWVGFDFDTAMGRPTKLINDAAMQALGSYRSGRMLFLGLGTGLGSAMVVDGGVVLPMELAHLPYKKATFEDYVGLRGYKSRGKKRWRLDVADVVARLRAALEPDDLVLGGGQVRLLAELPAGARLGDNANAFAGGFRLWE